MLNKSIQKEIRRVATAPGFSKNPCFYLYHLNDVLAKAEELSRSFPDNVRLYYAMKANPHLDILRLIRSIPLFSGVELASVGELHKALKLFKSSELIFTGPGKTPSELRESLAAGIRLINLESLVEAHRIQTISESLGLKSVDVLVRINTDYSVEGALTRMSGESTKLGIDEREILPSLEHLSRFCPNLCVKGFHVFSASGVLDYSALSDYVSYVFRLVNRIDRCRGTKSQIIDLGGGFGIDYSGKERRFDTKSFFAALQKKGRLNSFSNIEIILELGRYIVGECGYYVAEILDIKSSKGKKHIVTAGGVNHLRLPSATDVNQPIDIVPMGRGDVYFGQPAVTSETVDIGGPLCFSEDKIAKNVYVSSARIGDLVVVSKAGAYGYTVSSLELLSHPLPKEIILLEETKNE